MKGKTEKRFIIFGKITGAENLLQSPEVGKIRP